jgi:hypothetical protein
VGIVGAVLVGCLSAVGAAIVGFVTLDGGIAGVTIGASGGLQQSAHVPPILHGTHGIGLGQ